MKSYKSLEQSPGVFLTPEGNNSYMITLFLRHVFKLLIRYRYRYVADPILGSKRTLGDHYQFFESAYEEDSPMCGLFDPRRQQQLKQTQSWSQKGPRKTYNVILRVGS